MLILDFFQLPLSGSHTIPALHVVYVVQKPFQLPLSGSLDQQLVVTELLTVQESFNSLSRDHLGRRERTRDGVIHAAFNSLSRDHEKWLDMDLD